MNATARRIAILSAVAAVAVPATANAALTPTTPVWVTKATANMIDGRTTATHPSILARRVAREMGIETSGMAGEAGTTIRWTYIRRPANGFAKIAITLTGLADDSVAGERRGLNIKRTASGNWRLDSATVAKLCRRGVTSTRRACL